jgi:hypothetical protein
MPVPWDFLLQLIGGRGGAQFGQAQNWIAGLGDPNLSALQGWQPGMQAFGQLMGFNPQVSGDIRSALSGIMQDPWGGTAGARGTLEEMIQTGAPTSAEDIYGAGAARANRMFRDLSGQATERAAISGGLTGSGLAERQMRMGGDIAEMFAARGAEADVALQEAAKGRRMGGLGMHLQGRGLAAQTGLGLGGLEAQLSGQRLGALGQAGGLESAANAQRLAQSQSISEMLQKGQLAQAGLGLDAARLAATTGAGGPMMTPDRALNFMMSAMRGAGGTENALARARMQSGMQMQGDSMARIMRLMGMYGGGGNPTSASGGSAAATSGPPTMAEVEMERLRLADEMINPKGIKAMARTKPALHVPGYGSSTEQHSEYLRKYYARQQSEQRRQDQIKWLLGGGGPGGGGYGGAGGGGGPKIPKGKKFGSFDPATFTPFDQPMPEHPAAAQAGEDAAGWSAFWNQYAQQFVDPSAYTAGGVPVGGGGYVTPGLG